MSKEIITNTHLTFDHCFISVFKIQLKQESLDIMTAIGFPFKIKCRSKPKRVLK
jgi:hypothetical protein